MFPKCLAGNKKCCTCDKTLVLHFLGYYFLHGYLAFHLLIIVQNFQDKSKPVMTAYKVVTIDALYWGSGYRIEHALLLVGSLGFWTLPFIIFQNAMMHAIARQTPPLLLYIIWHRQLMSYIYDNNFLYVKICFASRMSYFCQQ